MKTALHKLRKIKARYAHWDASRSAGSDCSGACSGCSQCSASSGDGCHGDGSCSGDGE
jgi:hypothetical protein